MVRRLLKNSLIALVLVGVAAPPATASCPGGELSRPFLKWLDPFWYRLADGGSVDRAAAGWTMTGGSHTVVSHVAPDLADSGQPWVVGIGAGGSATSPVTCLALDSPTLRFMVKSTGSPLGLLVVTAVLTENGALLKKVPVGVVTGLGHNQWKPSLPMLLAVPEIAGLDPSVDVHFKFTVTGLGGAFQIDDLYVDPYRKN